MAINVNTIFWVRFWMKWVSRQCPQATKGCHKTYCSFVAVNDLAVRGINTVGIWKLKGNIFLMSGRRSFFKLQHWPRRDKFCLFKRGVLRARRVLGPVSRINVSPGFVCDIWGALDNNTSMFVIRIFVSAQLKHIYFSKGTFKWRYFTLVPFLLP